MALISLAVSYFRSLKRINVLPILTKYLLVHKKVVIPHIGTIELVQHPPTLNVADQQVEPFYYSAEVSQAVEVPDHQLSFLKTAAFAEGDLDGFGKRLQQQVQSAPFSWNGIGVLRRTGAGVYIIDRNDLHPEGWQEMTAQKVMRANAEHQHLVGDRQLSSQQVTNMLHQPRKKRPVEIIIAWILLLLLILFIVFQLFRDKFMPSATGLKTRAQTHWVVPQSK